MGCSLLASYVNLDIHPAKTSVDTYVTRNVSLFGSSSPRNSLMAIIARHRCITFLLLCNTFYTHSKTTLSSHSSEYGDSIRLQHGAEGRAARRLREQKVFKQQLTLLFTSMLRVAMLRRNFESSFQRTSMQNRECSRGRKLKLFPGTESICPHPIKSLQETYASLTRIISFYLSVRCSSLVRVQNRLLRTISGCKAPQVINGAQ